MRLYVVSGTRSRSQLAGLDKSLRSLGTTPVGQGVQDQGDDDVDTSKEDISGDEEEVEVWAPPPSARGRRRTRSPLPSTSDGRRASKGHGASVRSRSGASTPKTPRIGPSPGSSDEGWF